VLRHTHLARLAKYSYCCSPVTDKSEFYIYQGQMIYFYTNFTPTFENKQRGGFFFNNMAARTEDRLFI
jgi:hypothetical protein